VRQLPFEFIDLGARQPAAAIKVECLEVPEILEHVDARQLGAEGKVECLKVPEILEHVDARQLGEEGKVERLEVPEILEHVDARQLGAAAKVECLEVPRSLSTSTLASLVQLLRLSVCSALFNGLGAPIGGVFIRVRAGRKTLASKRA
jgi:hypothetical protein